MFLFTFKMGKLISIFSDNIIPVKMIRHLFTGLRKPHTVVVLGRQTYLFLRRR